MKQFIGIGLLTLICLAFADYMYYRYQYSDRHRQSYEPKPSLIPDKYLGWKLGQGNFKYYDSNDSLIWTSDIGSSGSRKTIQRNGKDTLSSLDIYGCSFTFGFSVSDTENYPYLLSQQLQNIQVNNYGVNGYSLSQVYLNILNSLNSTNKPKIIIIGYHEGLLDRTVCSRKWLSLSKQSISADNPQSYDRICLPCSEYAQEDSIEIKYKCLKDFKELIPYEYSALVGMINRSYNQKYDEQKFELYKKANDILLKKIFTLCESNHIKLVLLKIDNTKMEADLPVDVIYPGIDYFNDIRYNCSPYDPWHPNASAHKIYANKIYEYLKQQNLVSIH